jgi:cation:H+ antiporter
LTTPDLLSSLLIFGIAAIAVISVGIAMTRTADQLADQTGWGEAIIGVLFVGSSTSLPGIVTSVTAAVDGRAELAIGNALGGIAAQTVFLAVADSLYRRANLEYAAASVTNLLQGTVLILLLTLSLLAATGPSLTWWEVHPISFVLLGAYLFGLKLSQETQDTPPWGPTHPQEIPLPFSEEEADQPSPSLVTLWLRFAVYAVILIVSGWFVARTGVDIAEQSFLSETAVGSLLTAVFTSFPELITAIAAVRMGALTLAVGDIIGGNTFDVLFLAFSDVAYRDGSLYQAMTQESFFIIAQNLVLTSILLLGLLRRQKYGIGKIGFESLLIILVYLGGSFFLLST